MRRVVAATFAAWLVAVLGGPTPAQAEMVLNRGNAGEPGSLDPHLIDGTWEANIVGDIMMGLTTENPAARPIPGAAERWTVSADGKTWTFRIRNHVWSDGTPVTAHDFVFAWRRLVDPNTRAVYAFALYSVKNAQAAVSRKVPVTALGVRALDDRTLEVQLEHPAPYLPELATHQTWYPLPRHVVQAKGSRWARPENFVGNGAYIPREWVTNDHVTLVKNRRFYDAARVRIDRVVYWPASDSTAALRRMRAGELDVIDPFAATQIHWLRRNMPGAIRMGPYLAVAYVAINQRRRPFNDVRIREAMNLAYNREVVTQRILQLGETPAYSVVPPNVANYPGGASMPFRPMPYPQRIARAQALMAQAGYGPNKRLRTTLSTSTDPNERRISAAFQSMLKAIYIDVEIVNSDVQIHYHKLNVQDFDLATARWIADFNDAMDFLGLFRSRSGKNYGRYSSPRVDALLTRADNEKDLRARALLLLQAERQILADFVWIPTRFPSVSVLVQPYVKGWVTNIRDFNRTRWLWVEPRGR
jgi:oligopeptide transport system substrate-binding protein